MSKRMTLNDAVSKDAQAIVEGTEAFSKEVVLLAYQTILLEAIFLLFSAQIGKANEISKTK